MVSFMVEPTLVSADRFCCFLYCVNSGRRVGHDTQGCFLRNISTGCIYGYSSIKYGYANFYILFTLLIILPYPL